MRKSGFTEMTDEKYNTSLENIANSSDHAPTRQNGADTDSHDESSEVSVSGLVPPIIIAVVMTGFLIVSFIRYHRKAVAKRRAQAQYMEYITSARPQLDKTHKLSSLRVGSLRAGPSIYKRRECESTASTSSTPPPSKHSGLKPKQARDKSPNRCLFPLSNDDAWESNRCRSVKAQGPWLYIEIPKREDKKSHVRRQTPNSRKEQHSSPLYPSQESSSGPNQKKNETATDRQHSGEKDKEDARQDAQEGVVNGYELGVSSTTTVPNICLNFPIFTDDTGNGLENRYMYHSNDYYDDSGLSSNGIVKKELAEHQHPELTHSDSNTILSSRLADSLSHLED